jgi:hypothetical protein
MDLRKANAEINELKSACVKVGKEAENLKKIVRSKEGLSEKVTQENVRLRQDACNLAEELNRRESVIHECSLQQNSLRQELLAVRAESERLTAALLESESGCEALREESRNNGINVGILRQDLIDSDRELTSLKLESESENARLVQRVQLLEKAIDDIGFLFHDAILTVPNGAGYLLGSGKMLSMDSIARLWIRDAKFNGEPTYHLKCVQTDTITTVIHSPAVCRFVQNVASITSLSTTPDFYFRYSERPSDQPIVGWRAYSPFDQLTLVARLIHMYNADKETCSFQAMVMVSPPLDSQPLGSPSDRWDPQDNHVVTAACIKDLAARTARVSLSLNVTTKQGVAHRHHIEFIDGSFFPESFVFANE